MRKPWDPSSKIYIYIDFSDKNENKRIFDQLLKEKDLIESKLGVKLEWERLEDKRAVRIAVYGEGSVSSDDARMKEIQGWMVEKLLKFKKVFPDFIKKCLG